MPDFPPVGVTRHIDLTDKEVAGIIDHADLSVTRGKLEYPTEDVPLNYLLIIGKAEFTGAQPQYQRNLLTTDSFTDKAVECILYWIKGVDTGVMSTQIRSQVPTNPYWYSITAQPAAATADFSLYKKVAAGTIKLGDEAVDITNWYTYRCKISCTGSSIKAFRDDMVTPKISVTDTDLASGKCGQGYITRSYQSTTPDHHYHYTIEIFSYFLRQSASHGPSSPAVIEYSIVGAGSEEDPFRPEMPQELVEVSEADVTPEEWEAIQGNPKGASDLPLVDRLAVTWGAVDYKGESTMICALYGGSPSYVHPDAVKRHLEAQRAKGLLAEAVKPDMAYIRDLHGRLKAEKPDMLLTEGELAYQLLGREELEPDAIADFYDRECIDLRRISPEEIPDFDILMDRYAEKAERLGRKDLPSRFRRLKRRA